MLPYGKGGLNMPDIGKFWDGLKMAWIRRMKESKEIWWKLLELNLLRNNHSLFDLWYGGPNRLKEVSTKLTNRFWAETFKISATMMEEIPFAHPYYFDHLNLFDNNLFASNNTPLRKSEFATHWSKGLVQVGDFMDDSVEPLKILSLNDLNVKYNIKTDFLSYHRIKTAIELGSRRLNHKTYDPYLSCIQTPRQPILFKICNLQRKGCRVFYQTLRARELLLNSTEAAEKKWHSEINMTFSINFWNNCWNLIKKTQK